jgi:hypothetical protein
MGYGPPITNSWRVELEEPRYDVASWEAASDMVRFLTFAQNIVSVLSAFPAAGDETSWTFEFTAEDLTAAGPHADTCRHMAHVRDNYVERYALVVKLAYANIAEQGFHQGAGGQGQEPYHVVNDCMETCVMSGGEDIEFGQACSSFRDEMVE